MILRSRQGIAEPGLRVDVSLDQCVHDIDGAPPTWIRRRIAMLRTARSAALFAIGRPPSREQASGCGFSGRGCIELPGDLVARGELAALFAH
jgi:hypothetical protein